MIFYLMGKSATGKDSFYKELLKSCKIKPIIMYTTRPMRQGEQDGVTYHFTTEEQFKDFLEKGKVIEHRTYETACGKWIYYTIAENLKKTENYLAIGTPAAYKRMKEYYGKELLIPLYIHVEDGERLMRALKREMKDTNPKYSELCRRFLADENDFSQNILDECRIHKYFENKNFQDCLDELKQYIGQVQKRNKNREKIENAKILYKHLASFFLNEDREVPSEHEHGATAWCCILISEILKQTGKEEIVQKYEEVKTFITVNYGQRVLLSVSPEMAYRMAEIRLDFGKALGEAKDVSVIADEICWRLEKNDFISLLELHKSVPALRKKIEDLLDILCVGRDYFDFFMALHKMEYEEAKAWIEKK